MTIEDFPSSVSPLASDSPTAATAFSRSAPLPSLDSLTDSLQTLVDTLGRLLKVDVCLLSPLAAGTSVLPSLAYPDSIVEGDRLWHCELQNGFQSLSLQLSETITLSNLDSDLDRDGFFDGQRGDGDLSSLVALYRGAGIRSAILLPLYLQQTPIAVLGLFHRQITHDWQAEEQELGMMVVHQMILMILHAQAYERVQALAQREALLNTVTAAIRSSLDPQALFSSITHQLGSLLAVDGCALSLWTEGDRFVTCVGLYDRSFEVGLSLPQSVVPIAQNHVLQQLIATHQPVVLDDLEVHLEINQFDLPLRKSARALMIVPLIAEGKIIGSISLRQTDRRRRWSGEEIELAQSVAAQAAIAVQQARLYDTTRHQAEQLRQSEQKVMRLNQYLTESVLKRFLPPAIANKVAAGELVLDLSPEPRLVTILFSDLVGFTPMAQHLGAQTVSALLNEYLETMTHTVFEHGGTVDKFIGDAIVALFGAPEDLEPAEQVRRAIAVSRAMHRQLQRLNQRWQSEGWVGQEATPWVQFRCGIHQGTAVVGMFGGGQRSDYTAIGLPVNIAARLQETAEANTILVSDRVAAYLPPAEIGERRSLWLKGIEGAISAATVTIESSE